ncbi:hypothetical protein CRUP_002721 [Coryphaenoides rupestris]|nr:hypothetical protein CRUP_002721 [Coryphaenoides rupestris]
MESADAIVRNKTTIQGILARDFQFILDKVFERKLITERDYVNLKDIKKGTMEDHAVQLVDTIVFKGRQAEFMDVLRDDKALVMELHSPGRFLCACSIPCRTPCRRSARSCRRPTAAVRPTTTTYLPSQGEVCAVQNWYRGLVQSVPMDQKTASILYIDFGNEEDVPLARIRRLAPNIQLVPPCPVMEGCWGDKCMTILQQMVCNRILSVRIVGCSEGKALVVMNDEFSDPQDDVAELLLSMGLADPAPATTAGPAPDQEAEDTASATAAPGGAAKEYRRLVELGSELKQHCEGEASPCQATVGQPCCALFPGVEPLGVAWPSEALYFFRSMVSGPQLSAHVLGLTDRGYAMELVSDGRRVAAELLARNLARPSIATIATIGAHLTCPAPVVPVVVHTISPATAAREPEPKVQEETKVAEPMALVSMAPVEERTTESPPVEAGHQQNVMLELTEYCSTRQASLSHPSFSFFFSHRQLSVPLSLSLPREPHLQ